MYLENKDLIFVNKPLLKIDLQTIEIGIYPWGYNKKYGVSLTQEHGSGNIILVYNNLSRHIFS